MAAAALPPGTMLASARVANWMRTMSGSEMLPGGNASRVSWL